MEEARLQDRGSAARPARGVAEAEELRPSAARSRHRRIVKEEASGNTSEVSRRQAAAMIPVFIRAGARVIVRNWGLRNGVVVGLGV